uniref:Uncharacterized protein n=1 Tax=Kwoniella dejecticola CBS 10117 TaxID=1296121 RepID=A0A1A5ZWC5_9TREE|nr:uncharacterized protein I303_08027 [Kwoniella dejecticola CBS 10117]OBR82113.1 hypothetical protein I303_08027 [Kwoniella dejecticola CBS 10117]
MPRAAVGRSRQQKQYSPKPPRRSSRQAHRQSESQSQSQSQSQDGTGKEASWLRSQPTQTPAQSQIEPSNSFLSISTASLPPRYSINVALPKNAKLSSNDEREYQVKGEEVLFDAWLRSSDQIGLISNLRKRTNRSVYLPNQRDVTKTCTKNEDKRNLDERVLWYSAGMQFPCVCSLVPLKNAYTHRTPPPASSSLYPLSSVEEHIAEEAEELPGWYGEDEMIDLDPSMDVIPEFEVTWNLDRPSSRLSNPETVIELSQKKDLEVERHRSRLRKGKFKAVEEHILSPQFEKSNKASPGEPIPRNDTLDWQEEAKRRKAHWRRLIKDDEGYGKMWNILPLPYSHPSKYLPPPRKRIKTTIPSYQLPRTYSSLPHPFHPDLPRYIQQNPSARVYWLIPIHGPVFIPTLNHPLTANIYEGQVIPSTASFALSDSSPRFLDIERNQREKSKSKSTPSPIEWTSSTLLSFLRNFLHPLYMDAERPFGVLGYAFSGPKPDPFIDLPAPRPLIDHARYGRLISDDKLDKSENMTRGVDGDVRPPPVRPEAGDHLRIYVNAKYALGLRTWLHNIKIPRPEAKPLNQNNDIRPQEAGENGAGNDNGNEEHDGQGEESVPNRILYKTRLTLVGERGEVLIVA